MSRQQRHIDIIVSHLLRGDETMAVRHYVENRVSFASFKEARARASRLRAKAAENNGFLFPRHFTGRVDP